MAENINDFPEKKSHIRNVIISESRIAHPIALIINPLSYFYQCRSSFGSSENASAHP